MGVGDAALAADAPRAQERLRAAGSDIARKWPRCSLRSKKKYSDASVRSYSPMLQLPLASRPLYSAPNPALRPARQADTAQMVTLTGIWAALLTCGSCALLLAAAAALHLDAGGDGGDALLPALRGGAGAGGAAAGVALIAVAARSLAALRGGSVVAVKGDCPACGEEVYAFVAAGAPAGGAHPAGRAHPSMRGAHTARHVAECHVCSRPIAFDVRVRAAAAAPWRRRAHGRVYLLSRASDFFPPAGKSAKEGVTADAGAAAR